MWDTAEGCRGEAASTDQQFGDWLVTGELSGRPAKAQLGMLAAHLYISHMDLTMMHTRCWAGSPPA